jgi:ubiquinone/menaquinone biosynthesis C-methylase UbiE
VKNYVNLIDQISRVLRPGGLLILLECDFLVADVHGRAQRPATNVMQPPWLARFLHFVHMAIKQRGGNIEACTSMHEWVASHPAFDQVVTKEYLLGISPWHPGHDAEAQHNRFIASYMRADLIVRPFTGSP